ncbi:MAG: hypothetical protein SOX82_00860 [Eubacteriales bacterium]|nr:hypothetical protein [Eubacteriales bacterium]
MADKYTPERATSGKEWLRTWWKKVENNFTKIFGAVNKHIDGTADRHTADMIDYSDTETVRAKLDSTDTKLDSTDTKLDTKVDKVSGKSLIDSGVASSLHKQAGGIVYNASKDAFTVGDVSDGGSVMSDMNGNVTYTFGSYAKITSYDVEVKKARHLAHRLSEKANSSDVFLKSGDVVLAKDKIIKVIKDGESTAYDGSTENIQIRGDAMFIRANDVEPYGLMLSKNGIVLDTDDNENVNIKSGEITVYKKDSTGNSVAHKLTEKANTSDVVNKVDKADGKSLIDANIADSLTYDSTKDIINSSANLLLENSASVAAYNGTFRGDITIGQLGANKWAYRISPITGFSTSVDVTCTSGNKVHSLANKADSNDVLTKTNTAAFTPTADYQPATKKYVDDAIKAAIEKYNTEAMALLGED